MHGIGKIRDVPLFDWKSMKDDEQLMSEILHYFDSLVTTFNPCFNDNVELCDNLQDYVELVNKPQRHTRCNPAYCLCTKNDQQYCRFGFPKDIVERTFVHENDRGQPKLITARNDPYVNPHSRLQLQGWRVNVDLQPI